MKSYLTVLKKYAVFSGRARRKEYWMFFLFNTILSILLLFLLALAGIPEFILGYLLFILIPALAVTFRRLHDSGRSGWWILINIIPIIGQLVFLIFMVTESNIGQNKFGSNPRGFGI